MRPNQSFQPTSSSSLRSSAAAAELRRYTYFYEGWSREPKERRASIGGVRKAARSHRCAAEAGSLPLASCAHSALSLAFRPSCGIKYRKEQGASL